MGEGALTGAAAGTAIAPGLGTIIGSGIGLVGDVLGGLFSSAGQRSANRTNIQLAREQRDWNEMMWNKQNVYNSPQAQIERMRAAGLNPALMYSQGNVGNAESVKSYNPPTVGNELSGIGHGIQSAGQSLIDYMMKNEQLKQMQAQTRLLQSKATQVENTTPDAPSFSQWWRSRNYMLNQQGQYWHEQGVNLSTKNKYSDDFYRFQRNVMEYKSDESIALDMFVAENARNMREYNYAKAQLYNFMWRKAQYEFTDLQPLQADMLDARIKWILNQISYTNWMMNSGLNFKTLGQLGTSLFQTLGNIFFKKR